MLDEAFERALLEHREELLAQAIKLVGVEDAEDCLQEAMIRSWRYTRAEPRSWRSWLLACLHNTARDWHRTRPPRMRSYREA